MNLEEAKEKFSYINWYKKNSTILRNTLNRERIDVLCEIVEFLLDEIDRIKSPPTTLLKRLPEDVTLNPNRSLPSTPEVPMPPVVPPRWVSPPPPPDKPYDPNMLPLRRR